LALCIVKGLLVQWWEADRGDEELDITVESGEFTVWGDCVRGEGWW